MTTLTKEQFFSKAELPPPERLDIEDWGTVFVRILPESLRARRQAEAYDGNGKFKVSVIERSVRQRIIDQVVTEAGEPMFTQADYDKLGELDPFILDTIAGAIQRVNEEHEKNVTGGSNDTKSTSE